MKFVHHSTPNQKEFIMTKKAKYIESCSDMFNSNGDFASRVFTNVYDFAVKETKFRQSKDGFITVNDFRNIVDDNDNIIKDNFECYFYPGKDDVNPNIYVAYDIVDDIHYFFKEDTEMWPHSLPKEKLNLISSRIHNALKKLYEKYNKDYINPGTVHIETIIKKSLNMYVTEDEDNDQKRHLPYDGDNKLPKIGDVVLLMNGSNVIFNTEIISIKDNIIEVKTGTSEFFEARNLTKTDSYYWISNSFNRI